MFNHYAMKWPAGEPAYYVESVLRTPTCVPEWDADGPATYPLVVLSGGSAPLVLYVRPNSLEIVREALAELEKRRGPNELQSAVLSALWHISGGRGTVAQIIVHLRSSHPEVTREQVALALYTMPSAVTAHIGEGDQQWSVTV